MKKTLLISALIIACSVAQAEESSGSFKEGFKMMTKSVGAGVKEGLGKAGDGIKEGWDVTKDKTSELSKDAKEGLGKAGDGIKEGWNVTKDKTSELSQDAKEGLGKAGDSIKESVDSLRDNYNVSDAKSLKAHLVVEVDGTKVLDNDELAVDVIFKNDSKKPVKFAESLDKTDIIVIDEKGIAHFTTPATLDQHQKIAVPAKAAIKVRWIFTGIDNHPITLRLYDVDYPLPKEKGIFTFGDIEL